MIKLKNILNESSPGFENRQVGDALPTLDSVRTAYQAKKSVKVNEAEIKWNAVENAIIKYIKYNVKVLEKPIKAKDEAGTVKMLKAFIDGLVNAQRSLKLRGNFKESVLNESKSYRAVKGGVSPPADNSSISISDMIPKSVQINEGTRSQVGVIGSNGKIVSAYVHYDGYPSNMKPGLKKHMKSDKDVLKLIKMGGARGIFDDKEIEYYKNGTPLKGDSKNIEGYLKDADSKNGAEFVYLYNMKDKKWYYADTYKDTKLKKLF